MEKKFMYRKGLLGKACLLLVAILMVTVAVAGCVGGDKSSKPAQTTSEEAKMTDSTETEATDAPEDSAAVLEPVVVKWYTLGTDETKITDEGLQAVLDEVNKTIEAEINATLEVAPIGYFDYVQKMQLVIASAEEYDICTTSNWLLNLEPNVNKGAFAPLNDQIEKYCKDLAIPQARYDAATINGNIYAVPVAGSIAYAQGTYVRKDLADKYDFNTEGITTYEELEAFFDKIIAGDPEIYPTMVNPLGSTSWDEMITTFGMERPVTGQLPGTIRMNDMELNIINQYETPEFKEFATMMKRWNDKGYIRNDAAVYYTTADNLLNDPNSGKVASIDFKVISPSKANEYINQYPDAGLTPVPFIEPHFMRSGAGNGNSVSAQSKNIDRSVMLLALVNGDPQLLNTLIYGVEGINYTKVSERTIKVIDDSGYGSTAMPALLNQCVGNTIDSWVLEGQDPDLAEKDVDFAKDATENYLMGFSADFEPIKSEIANCTAVVSEYLPLFVTGSVDVEERLPEFIDKLQKAGSDTIIAELQRQVDQWKTDNGN